MSIDVGFQHEESIKSACELQPMNESSRREFVTLAAVSASASRTALYSMYSSTARTPAGITAQEIVERIKQKVGSETGTAWKADSVDTFKAGDPAATVRGIATTAIATMDVLKQAVK